jgi:hypothetical protein
MVIPASGRKLKPAPTCPTCKQSRVGFDAIGVIHAYCNMDKERKHLSPPFPPEWCPNGYNSKW